MLCRLRNFIYVRNLFTNDNMRKERLQKELTEIRLLSYNEIILVTEGNNKCYNEAHFSPNGKKLYVDYYHMGEFHKRYEDFPKFNAAITRDIFLKAINEAIKCSTEDETVKVLGVKN